MAEDDDTLPFWFDRGVAEAGASERELQALQNSLGRGLLPLELCRLLMLRNGGVSNYGAFVAEGVRVPVPAIFSTGEMKRAFEQASHFGTPDGVVAIGAGGHDWLGLDYREGDDPAVVYQEHDDAPLEFFAGSFGEFLEGLVQE